MLMLSCPVKEQKWGPGVDNALVAVLGAFSIATAVVALLSWFDSLVIRRNFTVFVDSGCVRDECRVTDGYQSVKIGCLAGICIASQLKAAFVRHHAHNPI